MKLQYKITLLVFAILLVVGLIGASVMLYLHRQNTVAYFEESALLVVTALQDSLEDDMMQANREHIQEKVMSISSGGLANEIMILSETQKVYASGEVSEIGQIKNDKDIARVLATGETVTRIEKDNGQTVFYVIKPVMNKPECYGCHDSEAKILGVIEIGMDRTPLDAQTREQTLLLVLIGGITFIAVGGMLSVMLRSAVVNPLSKLAASARRIAEGNFSTRVDETGKDEISIVARTFNEMAKQVDQNARALEDSKAELERKVEERTQQVQQLATVRGQLLERLISAQEEERRRVARELHDEAGQALSALMMNLASAAEALPSEAIESKERLSRSRSLAKQTIADLRKLIYDLRPEVLDQLGLVPALRSYIKNRLEATGIKVQFDFRGLDRRLSPETEITLFRIIQEAITNIVRHSAASEVNIQVTASNSKVSANIVDNGKGFDVEAALNAPESWGLRGIRERVAVVSGELSIESEVGKGTKIRFQIPLEGGLIHE